MVSMNVGIAGFLSLWGADLDTTTVVNILMSIGLSVDSWLVLEIFNV
jgi:preprotein translocase subunit SecF